MATAFFTSTADQADAFIGRRRELGTLTRLLEGHVPPGRSAIVEGAAGIGKTRLLAEFLERARAAGFTVLQGMCYQANEAGPYFPFFQALRQLELSGRMPADTATIQSAASPPGMQWRQLTEDAVSRRSQFLRETADSILRAVAGTPTVLCIEDVHWADTGSLLLLNTLLDVQPDSLFIVCTARIDERLTAEARQLLLRIEQKSCPVPLTGLTRSEAAELVKSLVGIGLLTVPEIDQLHALTRGNPLFLREVIRHLHEQGSLDSHSVRDAISRDQTPVRLTHIIDLRLEQLPFAVRRLLSLCAAIGTEFSTILVEEAAGLSRPAVEDHLAPCVQKELLQPLDAISPGGYRFFHPLFQNRVYELTQPDERRRLHHEIAQAGERTGLAANELARHYALGYPRAGYRRAIEACKKAAEQSERFLAYETAARFWELALQCVTPRSRRTRAELFRRLGWALWAANNWTQAIGAWTEAARLFESLKDWTQLGQIALALGDTLRFRQELADSAAWLERALKHLPKGSQDQHRALALLGSIRCFEGDGTAGLKLLERATATTNGTEQDPTVAYWLSFGFLISGDPHQAKALAMDGLAAAEALQNAKAKSLLAASLVHHALAQLDITAARGYGEIVRDAVDPADATALTCSLLCRSLLLGYTGDWQQVQALCEDWMAQVRLAGQFQAATARLIWANASLALGQPDAALSEMQRALPNLEEMRPLAPLHLARVLLALGDTDTATAIAQEHAPLVNSNSRFGASRGVLGDVVAQVDAPDLWQASLDALQGEPRQMLLVYSPISVHRVLGCLTARMKRWPEAFAHFETAIDELAKGGARWELAQTYLGYAATRRTRGRRGDLRKADALDVESKVILDACGVEHSTSPRPSPNGARFGLTGREMEVLSLMAEGRRNQEIAANLVVSPKTVYRHVENILSKMGARTRTQAVTEGLREGLVAHPSQSSNGHERPGPGDRLLRTAP